MKKNLKENKLNSAEFINGNIWLDPYAEYYYGHDESFICYPCRFATVSLYLQSSDGLTALADVLREEDGYLPMLPTEKHPDDYDMDGWYDFYIGLNSYTEDHLDSQIDCYVNSPYAEGDGAHYTIDIPYSAREALRKRLDEQVMECYGKTCEELVKESEAFMREDYEYERRTA